MEGTRHRWFSATGVMPWVVLFGGFLLALAVVLSLSDDLSRQGEFNISNTSDTTLDRMQHDFRATTDLVHAAQAFFDASVQVDRSEFNRFMARAPLVQDVPGFLTVAWMPVVPAAQLDAFIASVRSDTSANPEGYPWFTVAERNDATEYVVANYAYPNSQERGVMGYDALASPERAEAIVHARDTGESTAMVTRELIQGGSGLIVYGPVYARGMQPNTEAERRRLIQGYIGIAFDLDRMVEFWGQEIVSIRTGEIFAELHDADASPESFLASIGDETIKSSDALQRSIMIPYLNSNMELRIWARPTIGLTRGERSMPAVGGLAIAFLSVILFIFLNRNSRERAMRERIVEDMRASLGKKEEELQVANIRLESKVEESSAEVQARMGELEQSRAAMLSLLEDLTESRAKLEDVIAFDDAILTSLSDALVIIDPNLVVTRVNDATYDLMGTHNIQLVGKKSNEAFILLNGDGSPVPPEQRPGARVLRRGLHAGALRESGMSLRRPDGVVVPIDISISPIIKEGAVVFLVALIRDVTVERTIDRAKSEFVTLASHQLRTPLTAIAWYVELVLSEKLECLTNEQVEYLTEIQGANRRMINLVDSLLNVSRLEMGAVAVEPKPIDMAHTVGDILDDFVALLTRRSVRLVRELDTSVGTVLMDPKLTEVVVQNIVSNAIKYTPAGGTVRVKLRKSDAWIELTVSDTGIGIPQDQQKKVFEKLFRADNAMKSDTDGTGLGMYIVKSILQAIGGDISFVSELGKGTTFTTRFPYKGMPAIAGTRKLIGKAIE